MRDDRSSGFRGGSRDGNGRSDNGGFRKGGPRGGGNRSGNSGGRGGNFRQNNGPRELHKATCSDCGQETEVPFKPAEDRPVYCRECFQKHRPKRY
ncbi:CxxC-x17-CxxC domain-containing protein [Methanolobus vulcani]|uniref:CxxC-x17-CxxC domain-containing protein n=1 Tax=Methanolobus vulcani TaxID=38026 RepID=A0A7Z7FEJ4_9EURY|nr:CxxC-x17-CxxC domain-containing protein [Methanolobus vulcani]SDF87596.1 CxxC-x17-CxxC domain-containing protein [Methanolobus vulcani]